MLDYLADRGIEVEPDWPEEAGNPARLGVVDTPAMPEHEPYIGWITIPYLVPEGPGPVGMKFRCPPGVVSRSKYMGHPGTGQRLYGVTSFLTDSEVIGVTEGELDAVVASQCGIPSVAVPGVNGWRDEWRFCFEGYSRVLVFGDGDGPGRDFAARMAGSIQNARAVPMPDGHDVSSLVVEFGANELLRRAGL